MNNTSDCGHAPRWMRLLAESLAVVIVLSIGLLVGRAPVLQPRNIPAMDFPAPRVMEPCNLLTDGYLNGRLYGALDLTIDWHGSALTCDGMLRPNDQGIRLVFAAAPNRDDGQLLVVIGIDGTIGQLAGDERKANVTIIDEFRGRFFSTGGKERCWTMIESVESFGDQKHETYQVSGNLYCAGSLPSLSGPDSITLGDFNYSGRLSLDDS